MNPYENHSQTGPKVVISRGTSQEWLVISGVIDYFNAESVAALILAELQGAGNTADQAVAAVTENRWLHLDLSGLEFTDPAGIKALIRVARNAGPGQQLVLHGLPPLIRKVVLTVGLGDSPGLMIGEPG